VFIGFDVLNILKKYIKVVFVDLATDAAEIIASARFGDVLDWIKKYEGTLFVRVFDHLLFVLLAHLGTALIVVLLSGKMSTF
jgi:hypothetical protein